MNYLQTDSLVAAYEVGAILSLVAAVVLLPKIFWRRTGRSLNRVTRAVRLERHPLWGAAIVAGLLTLLCDFVFAAAFGLPEANYHDEFSYLLNGQTFALGRMANATPQLPEHFESFHILTRPSYQSKYPPGPGLFLAVGILLSGSAGLGIWLSHALAVTAICWFVGQFTALRWAFFGSVAFGLHDRVLIWWGQTYWGGAAAAIGGAVLLGGLTRWLRDRKLLSGVVMGSGAGLLALTRPAEGAICCACVLVGLGTRCYFLPVSQRMVSIRSALLGGILGVAPFLAFLAAYNASVTGDPFRLPYQAWMEQYQIGVSGPAAVSLTGATPFARLQHQFYARQEYRFRNSFAVWKLGFRLRPFFLPGLAMLAVLGLHFPRSLAARVSTAAVAAVLLFVLLNPAGGFPHYLAPAAAPITLGVVSGLRRATLRLVGRLPGIPLAALAATVLISSLRLVIVWPSAATLAGVSVEASRTAIAAQFAANQQDGLVLMLYGDGHQLAAEYVYNGPELRKAAAAGGPSAVWARALGEQADRQLVAAYPNRRAYVYYLDSGGGTLVEFEEFARNNPNYAFAANGR